ncbi:MAG: hypothetical protein ACT4QG_16650 [Sporichthyaceae bacterium]
MSSLESTPTGRRLQRPLALLLVAAAVGGIAVTGLLVLRDEPPVAPVIVANPPPPAPAEVIAAAFGTYGTFADASGTQRQGVPVTFTNHDVEMRNVVAAVHAFDRAGQVVARGPVTVGPLEPGQSVTHLALTEVTDHQLLVGAVFAVAEYLDVAAEGTL